jgi:UDP-N-acetylglucosamine pyrophosphorylase
MPDFTPFARKFEEAGLGASVARAFQASYEALCANETGMIPENAITPARDIADYVGLPDAGPEAIQRLLGQTVLIKLNGGLGTGMGLEKAKSLLPVRGELSFLDLIAKQILHLRQEAGGGGSQPRFLLMNSFSTSEDTLNALAKYPELGEGLEFLQNKVPKVNAETLAPVEWPADPELEWCPPGHGDIYPALAGSGKLAELLAAGVKYAFVSNSDNLGATLDFKLLQFFAEKNAPFMMEVCQRTAADRKGGHLAVNNANGRLLLRESAQTLPEDEAEFQDITKHQYFNTNNLWLNLEAISAALEENGGAIPLPMIRNSKTVDPRDKKSTAVFQLETAMGAAIGSFDGSLAVLVPRLRFAPVKTTADLLAVRSDAYVLLDDGRLVLAESRQGEPPVIGLDGNYKMVDQLEAAFPEGAPGLLACDQLSIKGVIVVPGGVNFAGRVDILNAGDTAQPLPKRDYRDEEVAL